MDELIPNDDSPQAQEYRLQRYGVRTRAEFEATFPGGTVRGPGSGATDDSILVRLNTGCGYYYGPDAAQLERHRAMLDAINAGGTMPPFARGGLIIGDVT
jgi:hypothetical protein